MRMRSSPMPDQAVGQTGGRDRSWRAAQEAVPLCSAIAAATSLATCGSPSSATTPPADSRSTSTSQPWSVDTEADQRRVGDRLVARAPSVSSNCSRTQVAPSSSVRHSPGGDGYGRREHEGDRRVVQPHGVHRRQRGGCLATGGHQVAQRAVEERGPRRGGRAPELGLDVVGASTLAPIRRRRSKASAASVVAASRPVPSETARHVLHALLGDGLRGVDARAVRAGHRLLHRRRGRGGGRLGHPLHADGVVRHDQVPARLDQPRQLELAPVELHQPLVQLVDLAVAAAVAEVPLRDVPEVVVVAVAAARPPCRPCDRPGAPAR